MVACIYQPFVAIYRNKELFIALLRRDFVNRTSGTVFGFLWLILQPALQVLALWFLMEVILQVRFPGMVSFVNYLLIGIIPWLAISESLQRSVSLYNEFGVLFKRNPFPILILPALSITLTLLIYTNIYVAVVLTGLRINSSRPENSTISSYLCLITSFFIPIMEAYK